MILRADGSRHGYRCRQYCSTSAGCQLSLQIHLGLCRRLSARCRAAGRRELGGDGVLGRSPRILRPVAYFAYSMLRVGCLEPSFIGLVVANPEPRDGVFVHNSQRTIAECDADRPYAVVVVHALKVEGGVGGGLFPEEEGLSRGLSNVIGKAIVRFSKLGSVREVKAC